MNRNTILHGKRVAINKLIILTVILRKCALVEKSNQTHFCKIKYIFLTCTYEIYLYIFMYKYILFQQKKGNLFLYSVVSYL